MFSVARLLDKSKMTHRARTINHEVYYTNLSSYNQSRKLFRKLLPIKRCYDRSHKLMDIKPLIQTIKRYQLELVSFFSGAVVLTFELAASRIVAPYLGSTIYIWTSIIGAVLAGLAIGYTIGGHLADRRHRPADVMLLLVLGAVSILLVDMVKDPLLGLVSGTSWPLRLQSSLVGLLLFVPPTVILGTIPPYLARLSLVDLKSSGKHIARINAAGTIGSLLGTFVTGYILFGFVGSRPILGILAICLLAISFLLTPRGLVLVRLLLILVGLLLIALPPSLHIFDVVVRRDIDTQYSRYVIGDTVIDGRPARVLQPDINNWESGVYRSGSRSLVFPYTQAFADISELAPAKHTTLMIGGGTFSLPEFITKLQPHNTFDAVEIDGQLASISAQYFGFHQPPNLHIIQADGRQFLNHNTHPYNLIYLDAFSGGVPPFQLLTQQATERIRDSITPDGIVAINIVAPPNGQGTALAASIVATYKRVFKDVAVYPVQPELSSNRRQNLLILASRGPLPTSAFSKNTKDPEFRLSLRHEIRFSPSSGTVLTDNYAPVERLLIDR